MTQMSTPEIRLNFFLSVSTSILGLLLWVLGLVAVKQGFFLIEYAVMTRGIGGVLLLSGLVWLFLVEIRSTTAMRNLAIASAICVLSLILLFAATSILKDYMPPADALRLQGNSRPLLTVGLLWLVAALFKLWLAPAARSNR